MIDQEIHDLLEKYRLGTITEPEKAVLDKWYQHVSIDSSETLSEEERLRTFDSVLKRIEIVSGQARVKPLWPKIAAAASIILCMGISIYVFKQNQPVQRKTFVAVSHQVIKPGKHSATLTLSNGKNIVLSDASDGQIAQQAGMNISKTANGQVIYIPTDNQASNLNQSNTLSTARGETYQVTLPDGTKVWLNASSSLTYPVRFSGLQRKVSLQGEGYFEVAKDKNHPFIVATTKETVTVLGTHFNINSYADDPGSKTTLLEGAVKISREKAQQILTPGQQAIFSTEAGNFKIANVDVDQVIGWKNGLFIFSDTDIQSIMRVAARWYDISVNYEGNFADKKFGGRISRYKNIDELLKNLELTKTIHFKVEGRKVTVMR